MNTPSRPSGLPRLPDGFSFGVATSAYQIEGAWNLDGKGPSIWDTFTHAPGNVLGDIPGDNGADHYHRLDEDIALLHRLGVDSYRFSLAWSRIFPDGTCEVNQKGVDFYHRLLDGLLAHGIRPNCTLYHWDLPQALEDRGGWLNRDVQHWFSEYAAYAFEVFGDRIDQWSTLNEPISNWAGYGMGIFAPGIKDARAGRTAMHHALLAHGQAVTAFRELAPAQAEIGIVVDVWKRTPAHDTVEETELAVSEEEDSFGAFLNPLFRGGYTARQLERWDRAGALPGIREGDLELISRPLDYFGLNIYNRLTVDLSQAPEDDTCETVDAGDPGDFGGGNYLNSQRRYDPSVVHEVLTMLSKDYGISIPIYVTENGLANCNEQVTDEGRVHDAERIDYASGFLTWIARAIEDGIDVRGYYLWSLLDNYEWNRAYTDRYGIVHVDLDTYRRIPKDSSYWYRKAIRHRSPQVELTAEDFKDTL
ncbi:GH1 family beta-glucosidase [Streptomyces sp. NPDC102360]|uniref:GH1 family beta-glucosidase n=1 Tax=Streptomyces sp. NPDC102360 TaxID=3366160 RepID=UPI00381B3D69